MESTPQERLRIAVDDATRSVRQFTHAWLSWLRVTCLTHGPMRPDPVAFGWKCHGFDGEGCESRLSNLEAAEMGAGTPGWPGRAGMTVRGMKLEPPAFPGQS